MDRISKEHRSWNMSRIQSRDTKPEKAVRSILHKLGYRFRLHRKNLPGSPDIVLPKYNSVIFVHGCFWHRHKNCKKAYSPKTKKTFWEEKFKTNIERDIKVNNELKSDGWRVFVVWECELSYIESVAKELEIFLKNNSE